MAESNEAHADTCVDVWLRVQRRILAEKYNLAANLTLDQLLEEGERLVAEEYEFRKANSSGFLERTNFREVLPSLTAGFDE